MSQPVLFASISLRGQLNPMLTLAGALARRGVEDVWVATDDECRGEVETLVEDPALPPVRFAPLGPPIPRLTPAMWTDEEYAQTAGDSRFKSYLAFLTRTFDVDSYTEKYRRLDEVAERVKPGLMIVDAGSMYAFEVAMTRGIPFIVSVPFPVSGLFAASLPWSYPAPFSGLPQRMTLRQRLTNTAFRLRLATIGFRPAIAAQGMRYFKTRTEMGIANPKASVPARIEAATAIFHYSVFGLEYPFPGAPEKLKMLGAMIPPLPTASDRDLQQWLDERESVVYLAFGTLMRPTAEQVAALVEVVRGMGPDHHVLWKLPKAQQELLPPGDSLPANLRIEDWIPSQLDVLAHPHVRVFFTHGGGNSLNEGLYFGKPLLVMPFWLDCYDLAARAVDSGAALAIQQRDLADPPAVVRRLERLLTEDSFRDRAEHWSRCQREAGGLEAAVDAIVEHVGPPPASPA